MNSYVLKIYSFLIVIATICTIASLFANPELSTLLSALAIVIAGVSTFVAMLLIE